MKDIEQIKCVGSFIKKKNAATKIRCRSWAAHNDRPSFLRNEFLSVNYICKTNSIIGLTSISQTETK